MEDREMQRIDCDIVEEEIPPTPEHIAMSAQEIKDIDINDTSSDEEKEDYHVSSKDTTKASEEALRKNKPRPMLVYRGNNTRSQTLIYKRKANGKIHQ